MPDNDIAKDQWLLDAFGLDVSKAGDTGAKPSSKGSSGGTLPQSKGCLGFFSRKPTTPPVGWDTLATTPPSKPVTLKSQAEEAKPSRKRVIFGVGERVEITASVGGGAWVTTAGTLSAAAGKKVTLTLPDSPGTAVVTVDVAGSTATTTFTVIAPSSVTMVKLKGKRDNIPFPNATMVVRPHIGPDTVNFSHVEMLEDDVPAIASGYWADYNGIGHSPNTKYIPFTSKIVSGKGTAMNGTDNVGSGNLAPDPKLTDWTGRLSFDIVWRWRCGTGNGVIATVFHVCATDAAGKTTMTKNGASHSEKLKT